MNEDGQEQTDNEPAIHTIQMLTALLIDSDDPGFMAHCIGIETGLRLAMKYPEYARSLLATVDEEMKASGADPGRISAEAAINVIVEERPQAKEIPDVR
jgi:hypothetical protein